MTAQVKVSRRFVSVKPSVGHFQGQSQFRCAFLLTSEILYLEAVSNRNYQSLITSKQGLISRKSCFLPGYLVQEAIKKNISPLKDLLEYVYAHKYLSIYLIYIQARAPFTHTHTCMCICVSAFVCKRLLMYTIFYSHRDVYLYRYLPHTQTRPYIYVQGRVYVRIRCTSLYVCMCVSLICNIYGECTSYIAMRSLGL